MKDLYTELRAKWGDMAPIEVTVRVGDRTEALRVKPVWSLETDVGELRSVDPDVFMYEFIESIRRQTEQDFSNKLSDMLHGLYLDRSSSSKGGKVR